MLRKSVELWTEMIHKKLIFYKLINFLKIRLIFSATKTKKSLQVLGKEIQRVRLHTHPEVVHSLADSAVVFRDLLLEVLIKARLYGKEFRKRWPVVFLG